MLAFRKEESFHFSSQTNEELSISITFRYLTHGILIPSTLNIFAWEDYKKKKNPPGSNVKEHTGQGGDMTQPAQLPQWQIMPDQSGRLL